MDKDSWKMFQKELGWDDEKMTYFYGELGAPIDTSDLDDFFNGGGQLEGYPPRYFEVIRHNSDKTVTVTLGHEIEKWLFENAEGGECIRGKYSEWTMPAKTFTMLQLKFSEGKNGTGKEILP